jgi:hypothetical protein
VCVCVCRGVPGGGHGYGPDGDKFAAVQKVLLKHRAAGAPPAPAEPPANPVTAYGAVTLSAAAPLLDNGGVVAELAANVTSAVGALSMELAGQVSRGHVLRSCARGKWLGVLVVLGCFVLFCFFLLCFVFCALCCCCWGGGGRRGKCPKRMLAARRRGACGGRVPCPPPPQNYGLIYYNTTAPSGSQGCSVTVTFARDRVQVFVAGTRMATVYRGDPATKVALPAGPVPVGILVENMGRLNYGRCDAHVYLGTAVLVSAALHLASVVACVCVCVCAVAAPEPAAPGTSSTPRALWRRGMWLGLATARP